MAGLIPQSFIDDLLSRSDIVEVIDRRVPLKKAGHEYQACCPFHNEKTPSFTVSPSKQFYHCFGCGAHGSALSFLMEFDRLSFPEAIEELAAQVGLQVPREIAFEQGPDHRPLYELLSEVTDWYSEQLRHHPAAPQAIAYLKQRGLSGEIAALFKLGFAPPGYDNLQQQFGRNPQRLKQLHQVGLIKDGDNGTYDRLRERVIFPIRDGRGRTIGFGGRLLGDGKPKYLNSPETELFQKRRELYGLYEARQTHQQLQQVLVVEGYMDVVALAQFGIRNAVATLGTATTAEHLTKLYSATNQVVFCFDGDRAGRDAAWKALQTTLPLLKGSRQARFLFLPEGEDPDTLVRRIGAADFQKLLGEALPLSEFLFSKLATQADTNSIDGRAHFAELAKPLIAQLPLGTFRQMMQQALSERVGLPLSSPEEPQTTQHERKKVANTNPSGRTQRNSQLSPMRRAVALLLQEPKQATSQPLPEGWRTLQLPGIEVLSSLIDRIDSLPNPSADTLIDGTLDESTRQTLRRLAQLRLEIQQDAHAQLSGLLKLMLKQQQQAAGTRLLDKQSPSDLTEEEKQQLRELYRAKPLT